MLPLRIAPAVFTWLAFAIGGLAMYWVSKPFIADKDRLTAAAIYMLSPYMIATNLVRFAAGELLVQAWMPLVFLWFFRAIGQKEQRAMLLLGCLLGLSWITNIPASIVLLYGLLLAATICAWEQRSVGPVLRLMLAEGMAGGLAAFYLLPVWFEQKWVNQRALILWSDTRQYMLFMPEWHSGSRIFKATCCAFACTGILVIAASIWKRTRDLTVDSPARTWIYLALTSILFQLPITLVLWKYLPELHLAQFPFRFLVLTDAAIPLILFAKATQKSLRKPAYILIAITALLPFLQYGWLQFGYARVSPFAEVASRWDREGYRSAAEYLPAGFSSPTGPAHLDSVSVVNEEPGSNCRIAVQAQWPTGKVFRSDSHFPCQVRLAVFFYPYWRAVDESGKLLPTQKDATGLLLVGVPTGSHIVKVEFHATSTMRTAGTVISLVSLFLIAGGLVRLMYSSSWSDRSSAQVVG